MTLKCRAEPQHPPAITRLSDRFQCLETMDLTFNTSNCGYFFASSRTTSFICLHGSAQAAQKLRSEVRCKSVESSDWKFSDEETWTKFASSEEVIVATSVG